jgi:hypothetical protein
MPAGRELPVPETAPAPPTADRSPRSWVPAAVVGTLAVPLVIVLGFQALGGRVDPPTWPLAPAHPADSTPPALIGAALAAAVLIAGWIWLRLGAGTGMRLRTAAVLTLIWGVPLALAPPLLSNDVYSYAAVGRMAVAGFDPYVLGPSALGGGPFLAAVDPLWRDTPTPYGPLLVLLFHSAAWVAGSSVLATVLLLRLIAVLLTAGVVGLAVRTARPADRVAVVLLTALNPVLLLHLVSGTHLDALIGAAAIGVVLLVVRGWWVPAMVLAVLTALIKAPALVLVAFVVFYVVRRTPLERRLRAAAGAVGVALATAGAAWLVLPDAFGWVGALTVPGAISNPRVPSVWLSWLIRGAAALGGTHVPGHTASAISRTIALLAGGVLALVLLYRAADRPDRGHALRYVGWALLVVAITGPVVYGWYLAWGLFPAAVGSRPGERGGLVAVSAIGFALTVPAMGEVPWPAQVALWLGAGLLWWLAAGRPLPARWRREPVPTA